MLKRNKMKILKRNEMKKLKGGNVAGIWHCGCAQHVGSWTYSNEPTPQERYADLQAYCRAAPGEPLGGCWVTTATTPA